VRREAKVGGGGAVGAQAGAGASPKVRKGRMDWKKGRERSSRVVILKGAQIE
jgi:hypothetical protein